MNQVAPESETIPMDTATPSPDIEGRLPQPSLGNRRNMRVVQVLSWVATAIFVVALASVIHQAAVNGNPLPTWAWLGILALLAAALYGQTAATLDIQVQGGIGNITVE